MKKIRNVFLTIGAFLASLAAISCGDHKPKYTEVYSVWIDGNDIYAVGNTCERYSDTDVPTLWKNGEPQAIGNMGNFNHASSVSVAGSDVYATIVEGDNAILWKNGERQELGIGEAKCIYINGDDVYVGGNALWKNGVRQDFSGTANAIVARGNDILIAGCIFDSHACLWKNNNLEIYGEGSANSIYLSDNGDIYVAGVLENSAALWKNGVLQPLENSGGRCEAKSVVVSSTGNVYVSGYGFDPQTLRPIALIWINGNLYRVDNLMRAEARALAISNGIVYIGGESDDSYCPVWSYNDNDTFSINDLKRQK